jgi:hypothetical protein
MDESRGFTLDSDNLLWFEVRRYWIIIALMDIPTVEVAPFLRNALIQQIEAEYYMNYVQAYAQFFEDCLAYELGYRGIFGALVGIELKDAQQNLFSAAMAVGSYDNEMGTDKWFGTGAIEAVVSLPKFRSKLYS